MEPPFIITHGDTIFSIGYTIVISLFTILIVTYPLKPKIEKIFEKNLKYTNKVVFDYLRTVDAIKVQIYELLEMHPDFDPNVSASLKFSKYDYKRILSLKKTIKNPMYRIQMLQKDIKNLSVEQYIVIQKYNLSALACISENVHKYLHVYYNTKSLMDHRFYAKRIIELFEDDVDKNFVTKWQSEFIKFDDISEITESSIKPGDIVSPHHGMENEILFFDFTFQEITKKIIDVSDKLDDVSSKLDRYISGNNKSG